jgi:hypothetical protein
MNEKIGNQETVNPKKVAEHSKAALVEAKKAENLASHLITQVHSSPTNLVIPIQMKNKREVKKH